VVDRLRRRGEIRFLPLALLLLTFDMNREPGEVLSDTTLRCQPLSEWLLIVYKILKVSFWDMAMLILVMLHKLPQGPVRGLKI
jgi:hypothetical protein